MLESITPIGVEKQFLSSNTVNTSNIKCAQRGLFFYIRRQLFVPYLCATGGAVTSALAMNKMTKVKINYLIKAVTCFSFSMYHHW